MFINVYAWNGTGKAVFLGTDTVANFEKIRNLTVACQGNTMTRGWFMLEGHEDNVFMVISE